MNRGSLEEETSWLFDQYAKNPAIGFSACCVNATEFVTRLEEGCQGFDQPRRTGDGKHLVPVKKSVFADYIVCLEDGKKMKMLKRYLMTSYGLTPEAYRERWKLPPDYPMVAPSYAERRSSLAKSTGLGRKPGGAMAAAPAPEEERAPPLEEQHVTPIPKSRGRKLAKAAEASEE